MEITIILPVYGRSGLLGPALESVLQLQDPGWQLLIADDGSDADTQAFIQSWIDSQNQDTRVRWVRRPKNLGLFGNLNRAIEESQSEWVLLLCSDDLLLPHAIGRIHEMCERWPDAGLILSTYESINEDGSPRPADSAWHHDQVSQETSLVPPERFVPALLKLGSLNGNLSGMAFSRSHWRAAGPFREDWRHAADWEWLLRASENQPLV
ncbi:MAG: glycosyltransferase family 2 protein, partial [Synechococcaceae bacterium WB9_4xC_028]|nr:glycosyltransferase family 2 protein [Synechococcaceae bacterium WB9_4xC_028]